MKKHRRSNKWTYIMYKDSAPENHVEILDRMGVPYVLSPWHDKDINEETGELKKPHRHGVLFFDSLKSESQVSELLTEKLNTPKHVEAVMSPTGMFHYLTHAQNPEKTQYDVKDIVAGCGFDLEQFIIENSKDNYLETAIDIINEYNFTEFGSLVNYARKNEPILLKLIVQKPFFFVKLLDSLRYNKNKQDYMIKQIKEDEAYYRKQYRENKEQQKKKEDDLLYLKQDYIREKKRLKEKNEEYRRNQNSHRENNHLKDKEMDR